MARSESFLYMRSENMPKTLLSYCQIADILAPFYFYSRQSRIRGC